MVATLRQQLQQEGALRSEDKKLTVVVVVALELNECEALDVVEQGEGWWC